jgi:ankyrin repeat protein
VAAEEHVACGSSEAAKTAAAAAAAERAPDALAAAAEAAKVTLTERLAEQVDLEHTSGEANVELKFGDALIAGPPRSRSAESKKAVEQLGQAVEQLRALNAEEFSKSAEPSIDGFKFGEEPSNVGLGGGGSDLSGSPLLGGLGGHLGSGDPSHPSPFAATAPEPAAATEPTEEAAKRDQILPPGGCHYDSLLFSVQKGDVTRVAAWVQGAGDRVEELLNGNPLLLTRAAGSNQEAVVEQLLDAKANPNGAVVSHNQIFGSGYKCPLRVAVQQGHARVVALLLERGAQLEQSLSDQAMRLGVQKSSSEEDGGTLLGTAAFNGHADVVDALLDHRADPDGRNEAGKLPAFLTPLMHAAYNGKAPVVQLLLERKAAPNIGHDKSTNTALDFAEMQSHAECVALLEPHQLPSLEELVNCLKQGNIAVLERWVARGGAPTHRFTAQMPEGRAQVPLLVYAAMEGQVEVVDWLLARKADPDAAINGDPVPTEADGHTPLMRACMQGHAGVVRRLLRGGAKLAQRSVKGHTALQVAERARHPDCAREFKEHLNWVAEERKAAKAVETRKKADEVLSVALNLPSLNLP